MNISIESCARLNNGIEMPYLGLGAYAPGQGPAVRCAVAYALEIGYRHIDTARIYGNEREVGEAVAQSRVPRTKVFITTKVWNDSHGYDDTIRAFHESLAALDCGYVDLYLIHWPAPQRLETWQAMVTLLEEGKCRAIGVSNFTIRHLEELMAYSLTVPAVNQMEFSPFLYQKALLDFCRLHHIQLEAYSPLTCGRRLDDATLVAMAGRYDRTPAQIMLRWALQHDVAVIPKSINERRITENAAVFDFCISNDDMTLLDELNEDFRVASPAWYPENWP
ncbi:MAG: aldo/keto reductase [Chloroflexi bacterium]|nr:aldo/keto reductase [Chloroflexota bacterium]